MKAQSEAPSVDIPLDKTDIGIILSDYLPGGWNGNMCQDLLDLFEAKINRLITEARIDEVKRALKHSEYHMDLVTGKVYRVQALEDRLAELSNNLSKGDV